MRHTATAVALLAVLGLGYPAMAEGGPDQAAAGQGQTERPRTVETHLKAAGYDLMQARQQLQAKNDKLARQALDSARAHIRMAEDEAPAAMSGDIRRIASVLEQASAAGRTDIAKARQQVAKADQDLQRLITQHGGKAGT